MVLGDFSEEMKLIPPPWRGFRGG